MTELVTEMKSLHLSETSAICLEELEEDFVLDVALQKSSGEDRKLAATSSNYTVRLFSGKTLASTGIVTGHEDVITGINFSPTDPNLLTSSSLDKTLKCWDLRTDMKKPVQAFEGYDETHNKFCSFDESCNGLVVCAGTEAGKDQDVFLLFWDRRKADLLGAYRESHQDDVTQVCFNPSHADTLATGSTDGLVNVFDVSQSSEDDALQSTLNSQSSVARIGWCGENERNIYCVTHVDTLHVWETLEGDNIMEVLDVKEKHKGVDYLVDCLSIKNEQHPVLVAGSHKGDIDLLDVTGNGIKTVAHLTGGHKATVRSVKWDSQSSTMVSGGEDSLLCLWTDKEAQKSFPVKTKLKAKKGIYGKKSRPYKH